MSSMFVRVSVLFEDKQLDVSLPVQRPVVDIIDDIVSLLTTATGTTPSASAKTSAALTDTHVWVLSSPTTGIIEPYSALSEYSITDGAKLYLTSRLDAAHTPFVDDALAEVRSTIGHQQWRWFSHTRTQALYICTLVVIACLAALSANTLLQLPATASLTQAHSSVPLSILWASTALACGIAFRQPYGWTRWLGLSIPVATALTLRFAAQNELLWWAGGITLSTTISIYLAGRKQPTGYRAGITAAVVSSIVLAGASVGKYLGLSVVAMAAWGAWVPLLIVLIAPTIALKSTDLGALLRQNDAGDQVARETIRRSALRTEAINRGLVWASTFIAAGIILVLTGSGYWQHGVIATLLAVVMLLRTHGFADARIIAPLIILGVVGLGLCAGAFRLWYENDFIPHRGVHLWELSPTTSWIVWLIVAGVIGTCTAVLMLTLRRTPDDFEEAKFSKFLATIDILASLAFIPVVLAAQGLFTYYWATS